MLASRGSSALFAAFCFSFCSVDVTFMFAAETNEAVPRRPNVLLICVDDLKPNLGCYGDKIAKSPHLDALAKRSVLFERAYCNQAVCAPSRNSLLTGLRPTTLGIYDLGTNFRKSRPDAVTLPQCFMRNGWRTEALGKIFHVGHGNHEDPASWSVPHWKTEVIAYALPESRSNAGLTREEALFAGRSAQGLPKGAAYEAADVADDAYPDGALAEEAIRRLKSASEKADEPFFLAVGFVKPHLPFCAPKKYWDLYDRDAFELAEVRQPPEGSPGYAPQFGGELRQYRDVPEKGPLDDDLQRTLIHGYYACISYMDAQLGRVIDELDRLGLAENTIIVLWGDHGWHLGDHGMWCKHTNYEQAAHIPLMVAAPGAVGGSRSASLVETVDLYPTLCELAGLPAPEGLDGASFATNLKDADAPTKDFIVHVFPRQKPGAGQVLGRAVRTERYRLVEWKKIGALPESAEFELFDYQDDPLERKNLAAERPEIVVELGRLLARHPEARTYRANR
jgi:iduronate 2-sulfatase